MRYLLLLLMLFTPVYAAEFLVMHGGAPLLDKAIADKTYADLHTVDEFAPPGFVEAYLNAVKVLATQNDLGTDPTNGQKMSAVLAMSTANACSAYAEDPNADVTAAPTCFVSWEDTTIATTACQALITCATPGAQLCSIVSGEHTAVKRNVAGTQCVSSCQAPRARLRIKCG